MTLQQRLSTWCDNTMEAANLIEQQGRRQEASVWREVAQAVRQRFYGNVTTSQLREAVQMMAVNYRMDDRYTYMYRELTKIVGKAK